MLNALSSNVTFVSCQCRKYDDDDVGSRQSFDSREILCNNGFNVYMLSGVIR